MGFSPENVLGGFSLLGTVPSFPGFIPAFFAEGYNRPKLVEVLVDIPFKYGKKPLGVARTRTPRGFFSEKWLRHFFERGYMKGEPRFLTEKSAHLS